MEDMPCRRLDSRRRQDGFTLVELMMATAITLIVLATATGTFKNALLLNDTATLVADSNQNLRAGTNVFVRDFMQAGRGIPTGGIPIPSGAGATALLRPGPPLTPAVVLNFNNTTQTTLTAVTTGYRLGPVIANRTSPANPTDIVTMLALDPTSYVAYPALSFKQMPLNVPPATVPVPLPTGLTLPVPALALDGAISDRRPVRHLDQRPGERHQGGRPAALHQRERHGDSDGHERQYDDRVLRRRRSVQLQSAGRRARVQSIRSAAGPRRFLSLRPTWSASRC